MKKAILLISHGSRSPRTKQEVAQLVEILKSQVSEALFEFAFLEIESPGIPEGIERCISKGATQIIVLLNFLNAGRHVDEDIPSIINAAQQKHPNIKFNITTPVGQHPKIANLFVDLINHA